MHIQYLGENMSSQAQSKIPNQKIFQDLCGVKIEVATPEDIVRAMKWILAKEKMEKDLDLDASIKITYFTLSLCAETQCYKTFDSITIADVRNAEIADDFKKVDERRSEHSIIVIPRKFASAQIVLKHENEYGVHYHVIYTTGIIDPNVVNGWTETIVHKDP